MIPRIHERLARAIQYGTLVPFVGSGLSAGSARLPLWAELVESGVSYALQLRPRPFITASDAALLRRLVRTGDTMTALSKLQKIFAQGNHDHWTSHTYAGWLDATFGAPSVSDISVLTEVKRLQPRVVVTTNYDLLLEEYVLPDAMSITWEQPRRLRSLLRGGSGIAHLHGRYDQPQSVIISDSDYQRIVDDSTAFRVSQSLFEAGTLLFMGMSVDGATDPHLLKLLENFATLSDPHVGEDYPHVFLHAGPMPSQERARLRSLGIEAFSYGKDYTDLVPLLSALRERERVLVSLDDVKSITRSIVAASSREKGIQAAARAIEQWVYPGTRVRVGYAERMVDPNAPDRCLFTERYVVPAESPCVFHDPISIAGWAVAEARKIAWPAERGRLCDMERIRRLGRAREVLERINSEVAYTDSPLRDYLPLDALISKLDDGSITIGDLYQDWSNTEQDVLFSQFLSVPVPRVASLTNTPAPVGVGVFNIDTLEQGNSLSSEEALEKLEFLSDLVYSLYLRTQEKPIVSRS